MGKDAKEDLIILRVQKSRKESWKQICLEKQISLTSFIIHSVENRLLDDERKKVVEARQPIYKNRNQHQSGGKNSKRPKVYFRKSITEIHRPIDSNQKAQSRTKCNFY